MINSEGVAPAGPSPGAVVVQRLTGPPRPASPPLTAPPHAYPARPGSCSLARALVYRLVTEMIFRRHDGAGLEAVARASQPVTDLVLARLALGFQLLIINGSVTVRTGVRRSGGAGWG